VEVEGEVEVDDDDEDVLIELELLTDVVSQRMGVGGGVGVVLLKGLEELDKGEELEEDKVDGVEVDDEEEVVEEVVVGLFTVCVLFTGLLLTVTVSCKSRSPS
jgi:hypothetical protein